VASSYFYKHGKEDKARKYSEKVDSVFLFGNFFPSFGLNVNLTRYNKPEVFIDFDTADDVNFLSQHFKEMKNCFSKNTC